MHRGDAIAVQLQKQMGDKVTILAVSEDADEAPIGNLSAITVSIC